MLLYRYALGCVLASGILVSGFHASASPQRCGSSEEITEYLKEHYQEVVKAELATPAGNAQILLSEETGTWTLLVTLPNGHSCVIRTGRLGVSV